MRIFFQFLILILTFFLIDFECASAESKISNQLFGPQNIELERPLFKLDQIALQQKAINGDIEADFETALRYYYGFFRRLDVPFKKDYKKALEWFEKAYKKGHAESAHFAGMMYFKAQGTEQNYNKAIECFNFARQKGLAQATHMLATLSYELYEESGVKDFYRSDYLEDAKTLFGFLADKQDHLAAYNLAIIKLSTEMETRGLLLEINNLLILSLKGFVKNLDKQSSLKVMEIVAKKDLKDKSKARKIFNNTFVGIGLKKLKSEFDF